MNCQSQDNEDPVEPDVTVELNTQFDEAPLAQRDIEKLVQFIAEHFSLARLSVSIAIADDERIRQVNREFLERDRVTDVISWDLSDEDPCDDKAFDMIVNAEKAKREAEARGHDERSELALYIVHGMLHNLGFDDLEPQQGRLMHSMENRILAQTGYGAVYGQ